MTNAEQDALAKGLGADTLHAVSLMSADWEAGPRLCEEVLDHLDALRNHGLVDREFADDTPVTIYSDGVNLSARVSACWHFRLTPLGLALRNHLRAQEGSAGGEGN